ncbi:hypothetical protein [Burkholderia multivorans]|uniref:hypothetical protein n=1 Tax=Burkholderia multivorans TaxID=87883 RepID=UPI0019034E68|nr:hypothetical protein [Burkholderia multivorans]MBJ9625747.1 hypothetical protein [Burkholderia multivorans]
MTLPLSYLTRLSAILSIPAGRAKLPVQAFLSVAFRFVVVSIALTYIAGLSAAMREGTSALGRLAVA